MVIININFPMLHTKFQDHRTLGSGWRRFFNVFTIILYGFVWVEALCPRQQLFSHVGTEPPLPGYYQYFLGGKCILLKDITRRAE